MMTHEKTEKPVTDETTQEPRKNVPVRTALKGGADADDTWQQRLNRYHGRTDDAP
jgi:hypothetical protein